MKKNQTICDKCGKKFSNEEIATFLESDIRQHLYLCKDCLFRFFKITQPTVMINYSLYKDLSLLLDYTAHVDERLKAQKEACTLLRFELDSIHLK